MKYLNNSSFQEIFQELIKDSGVSFNDEINIKNALSDHEGELEHKISCEMQDSFDHVLSDAALKTNETRGCLLKIIKKLETGDTEAENQLNEDLDKVLRLLNGIQL